MTKENLVWPETKETAQKRIEQAKALREQAKAGGLKLEVYLTPRIAEWILDIVEKGDYIDPADAVYHLMDQARELDPHHDLRRELLKRSIEKGMEGPFYSHEEVFAELEKEMKTHIEPARWEKIAQNYSDV